eukprot:Sspe_Gene.80783::Locus_51184_Transcript_1_1_Confidence_1.000_Length_3378::g.80783::m.80783
MDIFKEFHEEDLDTVRKEFLTRGNDEALPLDEFTEVLQRTMAKRGKALTTARARDLFNEIDFNGDAMVSWEEFTMFVIDMAKQGKYEADEEISKYKLDLARNIAVGEGPRSRYEQASAVKGLKYCAATDRVFKLSSFGSQHRVKVLHPSSLRCLAATPRQPHPTTAIEVVPEHSTIVTTTNGLRACFWDRDGGEVVDGVQQLQLKRTVNLQDTHLALRWCPRYDILFSASRTGLIHMWNMEKGCISHSQQGHDEAVLDLLVLDQELATASLDTTIKLHNLERGMCTGVLKGHTKGVTNLVFSRQHQLLLSSGYEYEALVWILHVKAFRPWKLTDKHRPHFGPIIGLFAVPNSPQVVTTDNKGMVKIWDIRSFACVQTILPDHGEVSCKEFTASAYIESTSSILMSGSRATFLYKYDQTKSSTSTDDYSLVGATYNSEARLIVTVHRTSVKLWNEDTGVIESMFEEVLPGGEEITAFCICNRGRKFFLGSITGRVTSHIMSSGVLIRELGCHMAVVTMLTYGVGRRGSRLIFSTSLGGTPPLMIIDDDSSAPLIVTNFLARSPHLICSAFCAENSLVAMGNSTGSFVVLDSFSFAKLHAFEPADPAADRDGCEGEVSCMTFLGGFPLLACCDITGYIHLWTVRPCPHPEKLLVRWLQKDVTGVVLPGEERSTSSRRLQRLMNEAPHLRVARTRKQYAPVGTAVVFHQNKNMLFVGDERGCVVSYHLNDLIRHSGVRPTEFPVLAFSDLVIRKEMRSPSPHENESRIAVGASWKAHDDEITNIQITVDNIKATVLTASIDKKVHLWTLGGTMLASLCQGRSRELKATEAPPWQLKAPTEVLEQEALSPTEKKTAERALEKMKASVASSRTPSETTRGEITPAPPPKPGMATPRGTELPGTPKRPEMLKAKIAPASGSSSSLIQCKWKVRSMIRMSRAGTTTSSNLEDSPTAPTPPPQKQKCRFTICLPKGLHREGQLADSTGCPVLPALPLPSSGPSSARTADLSLRLPVVNSGPQTARLPDEESPTLVDALTELRAKYPRVPQVGYPSAPPKAPQRISTTSPRPSQRGGLLHEAARPVMEAFQPLGLRRPGHNISKY